MVTHMVISCVMHLQALSSKPIGFLRLVGLLGYYIKSGFASTARARARLWQNQQMSFGSDIPDHTMSILLGLGFSVVAPLIAPIGLLYFLVMLLIGKYQMVYVFTESYQSGGKVTWPSTVTCFKPPCLKTSLQSVIGSSVRPRQTETKISVASYCRSGGRPLTKS